jgi:uncharacterized protein YjaG (DUF416 family)
MNTALALLLQLTELGLRISQASIQITTAIEVARAEGRDLTDEEINALRDVNKKLTEQVIAALAG